MAFLILISLLFCCVGALCVLFCSTLCSSTTPEEVEKSEFQVSKCKHCGKSFAWKEDDAIIKRAGGRYKVPCLWCKKLNTFIVFPPDNNS